MTATIDLAAQIPSGGAGARASAVGTLVARQFSFWYGEKQALFDIDLEMPARSITALIGPSGCGKSTFLRSINRMNDLIPGARHEGRSCSTDATFTPRGRPRARSAAAWAWCSSVRTPSRSRSTTTSRTVSASTARATVTSWIADRWSALCGARRCGTR